MYSRVLIPLDGSSSTEAAIEEVCGFAPAVEAVHLALIDNRPIHSKRFEDHIVYADEYVQIQRENGIKYMQPFLENLRAAGLEASASVEFGNPVLSISKVSRNIGAQLIVIGGKRSGWFSLSTSLANIVPRLSREIDAKVMLVDGGKKAA